MASASSSSSGLPRAPGPETGKDEVCVAKHKLARRRPEERLINDYALLQATMRKLATGGAYLSLTWSTVVLLGGFVSLLKLIDFWLLTTLSTSFALNLADMYEYKVASMYAAGRMYIGLSDNLARRFTSSRSCGTVLVVIIIFSFVAETIVGVLIIGGWVVLEVIFISPLFAIAVSSTRLAVSSYGDAGGDAINAAKLKASLQIFYSLALLQNILFCFWSSLLLTEDLRASEVSRQCGFEKWGFSLVSRYNRETRTMCAAQGALPRGRNLITFALGLLGSESLDDHRDAVRILDTFIGNKMLEVGVRPSLLHSEDHLEKLIKALEVGNDGETRERAARIVVALAGDLCHIDQFPTALDRIASLLQASDEQRHGKFRPTASTDMEDDVGRNRKKRWRNGPLYWGILYLFDKENKQDDVLLYGEPKLLISQGLLIIERLTLHQGNRVHICNHHVLLSKLTAPLYSHALLDNAAGYSNEWIDIQGRSLSIVARLMKTPGEASRGLRDGIASNTQAVDNLTKILKHDKLSTALKTAAIDILVELVSSSSDRSVMGLDIKEFISRLWGIFLAESNTTVEEEEQRKQACRLRQKAGGALAQMLSVWAAAASSSDILEMMFVRSTTEDVGSNSEEVLTATLHHVVGQLTDMLKLSKGPRTTAARILECLCQHLCTKHRELPCSHLSTKHRELPRQDVIQMLEKVLQLTPCITRVADNCTVLGKANNNLAAQCDEENPPPEDHTGNKSSSKTDEEQQEEKEFLVAMLSLAVVICDRMVDAHDFTRAVPQDMVSLVKKLKNIIQTNNTTTVECLQTVKLTCQLVVSMVQLKPMCSKDFTEHNFMDVLSESLKILSDLDNCLMLFDVDDHHQVTKTDKPLVSLMKKAQELFDKAQESGNLLA